MLLDPSKMNVKLKGLFNICMEFYVYSAPITSLTINSKAQQGQQSRNRNQTEMELVGLYPKAAHR